jgi:integrase
MARGSKKLTVNEIKSLNGVGRHADGDGLFLQIDPGGGKSWVFIYRSPVHRVVRVGKSVGKTRTMGLGPFGEKGDGKVTLARAREKTAAARDVLKAGLDPLDLPMTSEALRIPTFGEVADDLIKSKEARWRNPKTAKRWRRAVDLHVVVLRSLPVDQISVDEILKALVPLWEIHPHTANRVREVIEAVLDAARVRRFRHGDNPAKLRGNLGLVLPKVPKLSRGHFKMMPWQKLPAFMQALRQEAKCIGSRPLEFAILTCTRTEETRAARWNEIDLVSKVWTIPGGFDGRMKEEEEHAIPLCARTIEILVEQQKQRTGIYVFNGVKKDRPPSEVALRTVLQVMGLKAEVDVHGFRSTFRTWCGDTGIAPREIAEMCLSHAVGTFVERSYNRSTYLERRRVVLEAWSNYCGGTVAARAEPTVVRRKFKRRPLLARSSLT